MESDNSVHCIKVCVSRLQAFFQLAMLRNNTLPESIPLLVPLIERILFGTVTPPSCSSEPTAHGAVPTTETLIAKCDLSQGARPRSSRVG